MALKAKLCMVNVPAENPEKTKDFYSALLGIEFIPAWTDKVESYHAPVSTDGIKLSVQTPGAGQKQAACIFSVDNLAEAKKEVQNLGGRVVAEDFRLPIANAAINEYREAVVKVGIHPEHITDNVGTAAVVKDPAGNSLVLVELDKHATYSFKTGLFRTGLTERQIEEHQQELETSKRLNLGRRR